MKTEYFFHTKDKPRTTVCGILNPSTNTLQLAASTCPADEIFQKKINRERAKGQIIQQDRIRSRGKHVNIAKALVFPGEEVGKVFVQGALTLLGLNEVVLEVAVA